jgi:hypothetical protein
MSNRNKSKRKMPKLLLTRYDVRDALQIGLTQVDDLIKSGTLESIRIGRSVRVHSKVLWNFAAELQNNSLNERWEV